MKLDFENIGKRMPYAETDQYVDDLVKRCTGHAIDHAAEITAQRTKRRFTRRIGIATTAMAAAVIAAVAIFPSIMGSPHNGITAETIAQSMPLDDVLSGLSNDELAAIDYYSFDYIPSDEYISE